MHKVKSFARSKAHAHGYNPWSSDAGQLSATPNIELPQSRSPNRAARKGSLSVPDPNFPRNASAERRRVSPDPRRGTSASSRQRQEIDTLPTVPTLETVNTDRSVHFNASGGVHNTENSGEPPDNPQERKKPNILERFWRTFKQIMLHSWVNVLLVFVPIGIAADLAKLDPTIVFAMNGIAIVPLAGMLSYATESVAHRMGDTVGALMNVTFGNATELIVFIALTKNEISVVQASIIGSVLSNLLLILGMSFLIGGLRFREQMYNSTVTQMSACLLSISALSLLLPTAFHASFSNSDLADRATLQISRGTSVILLLVYVIYILFQLRSHSYLYASVPQHVIDEESHPGILHRLGTSSSSSSSRRSSISSSTSGGFAHSIRDRFRRMSQHDGGEGKTSARSSATAASNNQPNHIPPSPLEEEEPRGRPLFSEKSSPSPDLIQPASHPRHLSVYETVDGTVVLGGPSSSSQHVEPQKDVQEGNNEEMARTKRSLRAMSKLFSRPPGAHPSPTPMAMAPGLVAEQRPIRPLARRATSLPPRLSDQVTTQDMLPYIVPLNISEDSLDETKEKQIISRTSAVILLLCTTALVAVCAEFLVSSIDAVISSTGISEAFVGLILLPIIGNAAEHVTAVTVAAKNKMDLAIGVAVGSSIQIAIFVTPLIVLLGWILDKDMGLYFNIFETVSLFASCFVVNFLVLDGRSNYLEGALLCAGYIIIAVAAFFYPNEEQRSPIGSGSN